MTDWRPNCDKHALVARAELLRSIRGFFYDRQVLEVETPAIANAGVTDPHLHAFTTTLKAPHLSRELYLQTSPEYAMKRLLCAEVGDIYQISKAFRNEESGRWHNPEFTLLEWYRLGFDDRDLIAEVDQLLQTTLACASAEQLSYQQAFQRYLHIDPLSISDSALQQCILQQGYDAFVDEPRDSQLQLLFSEKIESQIGQQAPCCVYDFPASQAALARVNTRDPRVAHRFEFYYQGIELANGFYELADAEEQDKRFAKENQQRQSLNYPKIAPDEHLLAALASGLPDCAGVALGIDRLLMLKLNAQHIQDVISFTVDRA